MPTGADLFAESLHRLGIGEIFTLVGDHLNEVLTVSARSGLRIIDMRHESGVTHAADALARIRRRPAVSLVTGGPGHTNSLTGIATAYLACSPLIAVSGSPATLSQHRVVFQDIDQVGMARPVVKWAAAAVSPAQVPYLVGRAWNEAISGRTGPVHLTIPVDVFAGQTQTPLPMPGPQPPPSLAPAAADVERALDLLRQARRPVVIAGAGVWWADAGAALEQFLERTRLPYYSLTMARGMIPDSGPLSLGYADPALNKAVRKVFREADVVLVLGKRLDYRLAMGGPRLFRPEARFIQVDIHLPELGANRPLELGICADVRSTLEAMVAALGNESWQPAEWLDQAARAEDEWRAEVNLMAASTETPLHPAAFYRELLRHLPPDLLLAWDGGDFVHWGRLTIPADIPGGWVRLGPMATIGAALPNALALQIAHPGKRVLCLTGDGSLGFYIAELDTLVRYGLPVVIVVGNDGGWGIERELQEEMLQGAPTVACELRRTRYDLVMQGFGGEGETVDTLDQVGPAVRRAFDSAKPYLINVNVRGVRSPFTEWQIGGKATPPK